MSTTVNKTNLKVLDVSKLNLFNSFEPASPLWVAFDNERYAMLDMKVLKSARKDTLYFEPKDKVQVGFGRCFEEIQANMAEGDTVDIWVQIMVPNPELTEEELVNIASRGESYAVGVDRYRRAIAGDKGTQVIHYVAEIAE